MSTPKVTPARFTLSCVPFQGLAAMMAPMREIDLQELLCDRFMAVCEASERQKQDFAASVGLTPPQLSNIKRYRNPPPHRAIEAAARIYGITTDFLYTGNLGGMRDRNMAERLRAILEARATRTDS